MKRKVVQYKPEPIGGVSPVVGKCSATLANGSQMEVALLIGHPQGSGPRGMAVSHRMWRKQADGTTSLLEFCSSSEACAALCEMYRILGVVR